MLKPLWPASLRGQTDPEALGTARAMAMDEHTVYLSPAPLYHAADLAICRAGASTCAELAFFGVPALFVPYPHAAMDHQTANARALEKRGTADVVDESALTPEWLEAYLAQTIRHPERLARLREAALREGVKNGTAALADLVEASARKP